MAEKAAEESTTGHQKVNKTQDENIEQQPMEELSSARVSLDNLPSTSGLQKPSEMKRDPSAFQAATKQRHSSAFSCESFSSEEEHPRKEPEDNAEVKSKTTERSGTRKRFSDEDLTVLEETFDKIQHPYEFLITKLANDLNTSEQKVQRWFTARRLKWRRERGLEERARRLPIHPTAGSASKHPKSSARKK